MKQKIAVRTEIALRNIESSMRAEGLQISDKTKLACNCVVQGKANATKLVDACVRARLREQ